MPSIERPPIQHPGLRRNSLGLTIHDYEGSMSTLCAGCGHDSVTAAIVHALWEMETPPHRIAKLSGIGCSAKTTAYFARGAHGFNTAHGRMAPIATGAAAANRDLLYIGISGDGDSLSIGLGHLAHLIRRNVRMVYIIENNGVYGLTKGQFSPSADVGSTTKRGDPNQVPPIDPMSLGLSLGATFLARGFSGDKRQLVPIIKAAAAHRGLALIDVISPCVTFNDHEGSTKSYKYSKEHETPVHEIGFVPFFEETLAEIPAGDTKDVSFPDGSQLRFRGVGRDYDPTDRERALKAIHESHARQEILTGILYVDPSKKDLSALLGTTGEPLTNLPLDALRPSRQALDEIMESLR